METMLQKRLTQVMDAQTRIRLALADGPTPELPVEPSGPFTPQQSQVLALRVRQNLSHKEIGFRLGLCEQTVKNLLQQAKKRVGAGSSEELYRRFAGEVKGAAAHA